MQRSFTPMSRFLLLLLLGVCLAPLVGCGGDGLSGPTGTVTGKVTYNGAPIPAGCTVTFIHQETSLPASGVIADDGTYTLTMKGEGKVVVGEYKISIGTPIDETDITADEEAYAVLMTGEASEPAKPPFPDKYFLLSTSGLEFTVAEGSNTHDIELTDE